MKTLIAKVSNLQNGYQYDKDTLAKHEMKLGDEFTIKSIDISQSHTNMKLDGFKEPFNSVNFTILHEGEEYDIFEDPELNQYLRL